MSGGWRRLTHSLSARLMALFLTTAAVLTLVVQITISASVAHNFRQTLLPHVARYVDYLSADLGVPPDPAKARRLTDSLPLDIVILGRDVNWSSSPDELSPRRAAELIGDRENGRLGRLAVRRLADGHRVVFHFRPEVASEPNPRIGLLGIGGVLVVLYLTYLAIQWLFRPVQRIRAGIARIGEGRLDQRLDVDRRDELGELAGSINTMADEIQAMLEAKRQLLLAISHELRSPLTRARVSLELIEQGPGRDEIGRDLAEIDRLIAELLETERLNTRHSPLLLAPASINGLIRELVERDFPDAALELDLDEGLPEIALDTTRIQLMARNLIDNALRHGGRADVTVSTRREDALLRLGVRDQGPGVDPAHLPHLLEPFYRADAARRRQTGGFGLGLYLCRLITQAHGGNIQIDSRSGQGTEIVVYLPLTRSGPTC